MATQAEAALKADLTLRCTWGPDERNRMKRMADWTANNPGRPRDDNPHARWNVYTEEECHRATQFETYQAAHPDDDPRDNPHCHPAMKRAP
jgi:hypothetical protein